MTKAFVLDGKTIADDVIEKVAAETRVLAARGVTPGLAVVLVGEDPASQSYVAGKGKAAKSCGFYSLQHTLPAETGEAELLALVERLNADPAIHGILVQLPLPAHVRSARCSKRSTRRRTSTASTRSTWACSRSANWTGRSCPARRRAR